MAQYIYTTNRLSRVGLLPGGERNRVHLARLLRFPGCVVVISRDRWLLDRVATHVPAFQGDSEVVCFRGNHADPAADLGRRQAHDAAQPRRIRCERLAG